MPKTTAPGSGSGLTERVHESIGTLPTGAFAFVMATGIVSTGIDRIGWIVASDVLAAIAVLGLVVLAVATVWRVGAFPRRVAEDAGNPEVTFGFLTIVAAIDVVSVRLHGLGFVTAAVALLILGALCWIVLGYGIPARLMLRHGGGSAVDSADGSWFLWVVATQSVATALGTIADAHHVEALAAITVAFWGIGVMLYLLLATLVTLRLLTASASPTALNPSYWIYMGATAITVLAGSMVLSLPSSLPVVATTRPVVAGLTFVLWAFGMWWIPLLVVFGIWRHLVRRLPLRYHTSLWSIVFPLGMVSVASMRFGDVQGLDLMEGIGSVGAVVSFVAWAAVTLGMLVTLARWLRRRG